MNEIGIEPQSGLRTTRNRYAARSTIMSTLSPFR
jgi:hypothetical protein